MEVALEGNANVVGSICVEAGGHIAEIGLKAESKLNPGLVLCTWRTEFILFNSKKWKVLIHSVVSEGDCGFEKSLGLNVAPSGTAISQGC